MSQIIEIRQNTYNPNLKGGFEKMGQAVYPNTEVTAEPPLKNSKLTLNLTSAERKQVCSYLGVEDLDSPEGYEALFNYMARIPSATTTFNLDDISQFIQYKIIQAVPALVAPSISSAKSSMSDASFYVYNPSDEIKISVEDKRKKGSAIGELSKLDQNDPEFLIVLSKFLLGDFNVNSNLMAFDKLSTYLDDANESMANVERFLKAIDTNREEVRITTEVKEAIHYGIIKKNNKNQFYNPISQNSFGMTVEDTVNHFLDPSHEDELGGGKNDKPYTLRYQLAEYSKKTKPSKK